jgi:hypothetical protein
MPDPHREIVMVRGGPNSRACRFPVCEKELASQNYPTERFAKPKASREARSSGHKRATWEFFQSGKPRRPELRSLMPRRWSIRATLFRSSITFFLLPTRSRSASLPSSRLKRPSCAITPLCNSASSCANCGCWLGVDFAGSGFIFPDRDGVPFSNQTFNAWIKGH